VDLMSLLEQSLTTRKSGGAEKAKRPSPRRSVARKRPVTRGRRRRAA
jgi:hypothetical protein